jgi:hypothetical protein
LYIYPLLNHLFQELKYPSSIIKMLDLVQIVTSLFISNYVA